MPSHLQERLPGRAPQLAHPIEALFQELPDVRPYLGGMVEIASHLPGLGFFPGGDGLWKPLGSTERPPLPIQGIMILGNNFQCDANYPALLRAGTEDRQKDATWRNLLTFLNQSGIDPAQCFFTNAFMGLVEGTDPTATVPAMKNAAFVDRCRRFFMKQIQLIQPRMILALGTKVPSFLAPLSSATSHWQGLDRWAEIDRNSGSLVRAARIPGVDHPVTIACLLHPSFRGSNLRWRKFGNKSGAEAESEIVTAALKASGVPPWR